MQGSVLFITYQDPILLLSLLIAFVFCLKHWKSIKNDINFIIVVLLALSLLTEVFYTKGSLSIPSVLNILAKFLISVTAVYYNKKDFCDRYVRLVVFLSLCSLIIYCIQLFDYNLISSLLPRIERSGTNYYGLIFGSVVDWHKTRNIGLSGEPGRHQIYLITAMYFLLYKGKMIHAEEKKKTRYFIVLLITMLTAGSTTGFISLIILIGGFMLKINGTTDSKRFYRNIRTILILACVVLCIYYIYTGEDNFIYRNFVSKLFNTSGKLDVMVSTGRSRTISMLTDWKLALQNPLGMGYTNYERLWSISKVEYISDLSSCCGITMALATLGFHNVFLILIFYIYNARRNSDSIIDFFVLIGILLNNAFSQTSIYFTPILVMFLVNKNLGDTTNES